MLSAEVRSASGQKSATEPPVAGAWEPVHCRKCKRMLCRVTPHALRASEMIETKCPKCNALNYLVGGNEILVDNN